VLRARRLASRVVALRSPLARLATVALAVVLFGIAVFGTVRSGQAAALDDLDHALRSEASSNAIALQEYFERAQSVTLLLANDSAFQQLEPGQRVRSGGQLGDSSGHAGAAMAYLEQLYPGRISEACLIDSTGTEVARVVRSEVAPATELSTKEAESPFFAPTMRLPRGRVYQAAPYLSPDTDEWVISNSTPLVSTTSGQPWALVHFEVVLDSFQPAQARSQDRRGISVSIAHTVTGRVLLQDGRPLPGTALSFPGFGGLRRLVEQTSGNASATVNGQRLAVAHVPQQQDNANSWSVVVSAPSGNLGWWRSVGPSSVAMALAALLLLGFAGLNLRASHRELRKASLTDELTGLPNRRLLSERLNQALLLAGRRGTTCGILLIDLDRFKEVNDTLGHSHGDLLLRAVAVRLSSVFRESDTVSRLGGDEFAILLPDIADETAAVLLVRRCLAAMHEAFLVDGVSLSVEASIGLALAPQHGKDGNALLRAADVAMYEAKERKCGVVTYDPELDSNTPTRLALLGDLRRALRDDDQLLLHYQPKVDLQTGEVRGVEALVRWQHPERGLVLPAAFIPAAEGTGLILPLTIRTLQIAIAQAWAWQDQGQAVQVAVNLSPRCLLEPAFPTLVQDLLDQHQLPPRLLRLEITESTIMADPARALASLTALQQSGISLSIDDFGTGYSSMSYLKRLPVDELKIDRSFILDMLGDNSDNVLVRSSIDLGHNLGLSVVAEGVEDQATVTALAGLGCDVLQGYHLARPMTATATTEWMRSRAAQPSLTPT